MIFCFLAVLHSVDRALNALLRKLLRRISIDRPLIFLSSSLLSWYGSFDLFPSDLSEAPGLFLKKLIHLKVHLPSLFSRFALKPITWPCLNLWLSRLSSPLLFACSFDFWRSCVERQPFHSCSFRSQSHTSCQIVVGGGSHRDSFCWPPPWRLRPQDCTWLGFRRGRRRCRVCATGRLSRWCLKLTVP